MTGTRVPRDPNVSPEVRRFLDELARVQNLFDGVTTAAAATALLNVFTSALKGLAPASGGGTTNFLRADGTWAAPTPPAITRSSAASVGTGTTYTISSIATHTFAILQVGDLSHNSGATQSFQIELSANNGSSWSTPMGFTEVAIGGTVMQTDTLFISHDGSFNYQITHDIRTTGANAPIIALGAQMDAIRLSPTGGNFDSGRAYLHIL